MLNSVSSVMLRTLVLLVVVFPSAGERSTTRRVVSWCAGSSSSSLELESIKTSCRIVRIKYIRLQKQGFNLLFFVFFSSLIRDYLFNRTFCPFLAFLSGFFFSPAQFLTRKVLFEPEQAPSCGSLSCLGVGA